jgi:ubiquitin
LIFTLVMSSRQSYSTDTDFNSCRSFIQFKHTLPTVFSRRFEQFIAMSTPPVPKSAMRSRSPRTPSPRSPESPAPIQYMTLPCRYKDQLIGLFVKSTGNVDEVKALIQDKVGIPPEHQILSINGEPWVDGLVSEVYDTFSIVKILELWSLRVYKMTGESFEILVTDDDNINKIKCKICVQQNIPLDAQQLVFDGNHISDGPWWKNLSDYNISKDAQHQLILVIVELGFQIRVHDLDTLRSIWLDVKASDTIADVKTQIQDKVGYPPDQQRLTLGSNHLEDGRKLSDYDINNENDRIDLYVMDD